MSDSRPEGRTTGLATRAGEKLGSPAALAVSVVVLVSAVGMIATYSSYVALCRLGRAEAQARLHAESTRLQASVGGALFVADDLLDRLGPAVRALPTPVRTEDLLKVLYVLGTARPGLTWLSVSFPDGSYVGVVRDGQDGRLRGQENWLAPEGGVERKFAFDASGRVQEISRKGSDYDPRTRDFYKRAVARRGRLWTAPYPFLPDYHTGISRVEPLFTGEGDRELLAVLTVDFDASALTELLGHEEGTRDLVMAADGSLLATAGVALPAPGKWPRDRALRTSDLDDAVVRAVGAVALSAGANADGPLDVGDTAYLVDAVPVVSLDGSPITLVRARSEAELYGPAQRNARRNVLITAAIAVIGLGFAFALSASIARLRRARQNAELAALAARAEADELGSYELLELLGSGGMGEVYRARHKLLSREAALKLIRADDAEHATDLRTQFFLEARRLASMRSIHTVSVYDFGQARDGRYFLAMELLDGLDVDALVRRYGPQPPGRVAAILAQVCDSLAEAHARGLVHQDIKPANVFLCRLAEALDVVKVLDFGIARAVGPRGARLSRTEGTPAFMSPEQILGEPVGPLSDIYAVGGLGHYLLTGQPPYSGGSSNSIQLAHIEQPIPELREVAGPELAQVLTRCLAKRSEHRPVSAQVLARVLRDLAPSLADSFPDAARETFWREFTPSGGPTVPALEHGSSHVREAAGRIYTRGHLGVRHG